MPTFTVTDPYGRQARITGDTVPTEDELNKIFEAKFGPSTGAFGGPLVGGASPGYKEETSTLGSFGRSLARSIGPGAAGIGGGALGGAVAGLYTGPGAVFAVPAGTLIGGIGGAYVGRKAQDYIADEIAPDSIFGTKSAALDAQQHPVASLIGEAFGQGRPSFSSGLRGVRNVATAEGRQLLGEAGRSLASKEALAAARSTGQGRRALTALGETLDTATGAGVGAGMSVAAGEDPGMVALNALVGGGFNRSWIPGHGLRRDPSPVEQAPNVPADSAQRVPVPEPTPVPLDERQLFDVPRNEVPPIQETPFQPLPQDQVPPVDPYAGHPELPLPQNGETIPPVALQNAVGGEGVLPPNPVQQAEMTNGDEIASAFSGMGGAIRENYRKAVRESLEGTGKMPSAEVSANSMANQAWELIESKYGNTPESREGFMRVMDKSGEGTPDSWKNAINEEFSATSHEAEIKTESPALEQRLQTKESANPPIAPESVVEQPVRSAPEPGPWEDAPMVRHEVPVEPTRITEATRNVDAVETPTTPVQEAPPVVQEPTYRKATLEETLPAGTKVVSSLHGPAEVVKDHKNRAKIRLPDGTEHGVPKNSIQVEIQQNAEIPAVKPTLEQRLQGKSEQLGESIKADLSEGRNYSALFPGADPVTAKRVYKLAVDTALASVRAGKRIGQAANIAIQKLKELGHKFDEKLLRKELVKNLPDEMDRSKQSLKEVDRASRMMAQESSKESKPKPTLDEFKKSLKERFPDHDSLIEENAPDLYTHFDDPDLRPGDYPETKGNPEVNDLYESAGETFQNVVESVKSGKGLEKVKRVAAKANENIFMSKSGVLERIAEGKSVKGTTRSQAAIEFVRNAIGSKPGSEGPGKLGLAKEHIQNERAKMNLLDDAIKPIESRLERMSSKTKDEFLDRIGRIMTDESYDLSKEPKDIQDFIENIRKINEKNKLELTKAGYEIGDFGPRGQSRIINRERLFNNPDKFLSQAEKAYKEQFKRKMDAATKEGNLKEADEWRTKMKSPTEAKRSAERWKANLEAEADGMSVDGDDFRMTGAGDGVPDFLKPREFGPEAEKFLDDFYIKNPLEVASITSSATEKLLTRAKLLGEVKNGKLDPLGKWEKLRKTLIEEGNGKMVGPLAEDLARTFRINQQVSPRTQKFLEYTGFWQNLAFLDRALLSSIPEPLTIGVSMGSVRKMGQAFGKQMLDSANYFRGAPKPARAFLAERLGFSSSGLMSKMASMRASDPFSSGFAGRKLQQFFRNIGLQGYTDITGWVSAEMNSERVLALTKMVELDSKLGKTKAKRSLERLGVDTDEKLSQLEDFVKTIEKKSSDEMLREIAVNESKGADVFRDAVRLADRDGRADPSIADKSRFAEHPAGALFSSLQSFLYTHARNVGMKVVRDAATGIRGTSTLRGKEVKLTAGERAEMALKVPALATLGMGAANLGITMLRESLFTDPDRKRADAKKSDSDIWLGRIGASASRANFLGPYDTIFNAFTSAKYQRDPATIMVGPVWGAASELFSSGVGMFGERNSPNTNTAERKLSRLIYNIGVKPAQSAALTALPFPRVAGALNYAVGHPATRAGFVDITAGKPTTLKRGQGGKKGPTQY